MGLPRLERLSREDERVLELEHGAVAGHWCKVVVVDGELDVAELRRSVGARLAAVPRLRQRLRFLPRGLGRPIWVDDEYFDLAWHVAPVTPPAPLDDLGLRELVASRIQDRLDRTRPLWRLEVAPLSDGRTALLWRVHHCMADGFTAMEIAATCIWGAPESATPARQRQRAQPPPSRARMVAAAAFDRGAAAAREMRALARQLSATRHWRAGVTQIRGVVDSARRELEPGPISACFDAPLGRSRAVAWRTLPLSRLHAAAKRVGATVTLNDAVVALIASGVGEWASARGRTDHPLRVRIPVSLHGGDGAAAANRDSFIDVDVALDDGDVVRRLKAINAQTAARKTAHDAEHVDELMRGVSAVPFGSHLIAVAEGPHHFSLCVSNVVGPRQPVAVDGVPVSELHAIVEVGEHHDLRASAISCGDRLSLALCADADVVEPETVMRGIDAAWDQLERSAPTGAG